MSGRSNSGSKDNRHPLPKDPKYVCKTFSSTHYDLRGMNTQGSFNPMKSNNPSIDLTTNRTGGGESRHYYAGDPSRKYIGSQGNDHKETNSRSYSPVGKRY